MRQGIYAIRDSKTEAFSTPFFSFNNATAIRSFTDAVNDPNTNLNKHSEDFAIFHIADWDDITGELTPVTPTNLGLATDYKESQNGLPTIT